MSVQTVDHFFNPSSKDFIHDPIPTLEKLSSEFPISRFDQWHAWLVTGHLVGWLTIVFRCWLTGNAILCAFNLIPFGPLDGKKIKSWSEPIFYTCLSVAIAMVYITFTTDWSP